MWQIDPFLEAEIVCSCHTSSRVATSAEIGAANNEPTKPLRYFYYCLLLYFLLAHAPHFQITPSASFTALFAHVGLKCCDTIS